MHMKFDKNELLAEKMLHKDFYNGKDEIFKLTPSIIFRLWRSVCQNHSRMEAPTRHIQRQMKAIFTALYCIVNISILFHTLHKAFFTSSPKHGILSLIFAISFDTSSILDLKMNNLLRGNFRLRCILQHRLESTSSKSNPTFDVGAKGYAVEAQLSNCKLKIETKHIARLADGSAVVYEGNNAVRALFWVKARKWVFSRKLSQRWGFF